MIAAEKRNVILLETIMKNKGISMDLSIFFYLNIFQVRFLVPLLVMAFTQTPLIAPSSFNVMGAKRTVEAVDPDSCLTRKAIVIGHKTSRVHE